MRCRRTGPDDIPAMTALWREAFGDSEAEIARFFETVFPDSEGFAAEEDGALASMLFALPVTLAAGEQTARASYFYAVATLRAFRGRGLARGLMEYAEKRLQKNGVRAVLLVPGEPSLVSFYEPLGYTGRTLLAEKYAEGVEPRGQGQLVTPIEYAGLRETLLGGMPHVRYSLPQLRYEEQTTSFFALRLGSRAGCAAASLENGRVTAREILPDESMLPALAAALPGQEYCLRAPGGSRAFGMVKWLSQPEPGLETPYLAFAFE
jgi:ribosomal protein S18 acetylase RimI-like enzyme